jgi:hypothetical protein
MGGALARFGLVATATLGLVGCGADQPELAASAEPGAAPDRVVSGPQGNRGQFVVECGFDRFLADDPIVHPGQAGASHLHQFFGAVGVSVDSEAAALLAGETTCDQRDDTASYWSPVLIDASGETIQPLRSVAYYRAGPDVAVSDVVPYPAGLMMVAGDHTAIEPQPLSVVAWSCGTGARRDVRPLACEAPTTLRMTITFPDCWNGVDVRSPIVPMPSKHVAYSAAGECPDSHPVHVPQLQFAVDFPPQPADTLDSLRLSSGDILSGHADFWNVWNQDKLEREVQHCIQRDLPCGVSG